MQSCRDGHCRHLWFEALKIIKILVIFIKKKDKLNIFVEFYEILLGYH